MTEFCTLQIVMSTLYKAGQVENSETSEISEISEIFFRDF